MHKCIHEIKLSSHWASRIVAWVTTGGWYGMVGTNSLTSERIFHGGGRGSFFFFFFARHITCSWFNPLSPKTWTPGHEHKWKRQLARLPLTPPHVPPLTQRQQCRFFMTTCNPIALELTQVHDRFSYISCICGTHQSRRKGLKFSSHPVPWLHTFHSKPQSRHRKAEKRSNTRYIGLLPCLLEAQKSACRGCGCQRIFNCTLKQAQIPPQANIKPGK